MKKLDFKIVDYKNDIYGEGTIIYKNEIQNLLLVPADPTKGTTPDEMRKVIPIYMKILAAEGEYVVLEDAEHKVVADRFENAVFKFNSPEIHNLCEDIKNAPEYHLKEVGNA